MVKSTIKTIVLLIGIVSTAVAQTKTTVSGSVQDEKGKGLPNVNISLLSAKDSSLQKAGITDLNGEYELSVLKSGSYLLSFTSLGYQLKYSPIVNIGDDQNFKAPTIKLLPATTDMKDVVVVSKKPMIEVKADKTVFNVENSINATGSSALELLQKSPGITVDNNDNISMKGKTGVKIYVDGKMMQLDSKDLAAYLKSINSNDIEAIEMISNPSAKYDASGNAGVINLKLKKNKKFGMNGNANATFIEGITPKGNGSVSLNYRDKKINIFSNIGGDIGVRENTLNLYRLQSDTIYDQHSVNRNNQQSSNVKLGADYFINNKSTLGVMANGNFSDDKFTSTGNTVITYNPTQTYIKTLQALNNNPGSRTNANFNFNYRYSDTSGTEINFDGDHGLFRGSRHSYQPNNYIFPFTLFNYSVINTNYTPTDIDINTAKIDVEHKLWKGKISYGAKYSNVKTNNTFDFFDVNGTVTVKDLSKSNGFVYTENVNAGYVNFNRAVNSKLNIQAGVRVEQTNSEGKLTRADGIQQSDDDVKKDYIDLFPSAAITWTINTKHSLNLTYSKRIDRPSYQDLNPFENKLDELTYQKGNAFLRPQYTQSVELTHTFMGFINTTVGYSHVSDFATEVTDTLHNATYVQQRNLATQQIVSFNIGAPTPIKKWWNGYFNFWYSYQMFDGAIDTNKVKINIPLYGAYLQQSFTLGKYYTAELSGWYNGPAIWGGTWRTKPQGGIDVGVQKLFLQKKATVKISFTDLLATMSPWRANNNFGGNTINANGSWESRTVRLSVSYRFGNNQVNAARNRKTGIESEAGRIK